LMFNILRFFYVHRHVQRPLCGARVRDGDRRLRFTSSDTKL